MDSADTPLVPINDDWDPMDKAFWLRELRQECEDTGAKWSPQLRERQATWLAVYAMTGGKLKASAVAKITRKTSALWQREDPIFEKMVGYADEAFSDQFQAEGARRAVRGVSVAIRNSRTGEVLGHELKHSDALLIHMMKGRDSEGRWAKKLDSGTAPEETWRNLLVRIKDDPDALAALDVLADKLHEG